MIPSTLRVPRPMMLPPTDKLRFNETSPFAVIFEVAFDKITLPSMVVVKLGDLY